MTAQKIRTLPAKEALQIMDAIWQNMREHFETADPSPEFIALLRSRREHVDD